MTIYNDTKYTRWHYAIIENARLQERAKGNGIYYESHHIIPRSLGGDNEDDNLILLTPKEHFIVHALLVRMTTGRNRRKMIFALQMMTGVGKYKSRLFEYHRIEHAENMSKIHRGKIVSIESRNKMSESLKGHVTSNSTRQKIGDANRGRMGQKHSQASKDKIGIAHRGKFVSDETRKRLSESLKAYHVKN